MRGGPPRFISWPSILVMTASMLMALAGCATIQPMSLRDARRPGSSALATDGQAVTGYFDARGEFHEFRGYARVVGDRVELFRRRPQTPPSAWNVRAPAARAPAGSSADSVRTLMLLRHRSGWSYIATFLAGAATVVGSLLTF